jgi:hypothetical protein
MIPSADLAQLDTRVKQGGEITNQRPEVYPLFGGEEECQPTAVKGILRLYQLHGKAMELHALGAPSEHLFLFRFKAEHLAQVILHRQPINRFQAFAADFGVGYLPRSYHHSTAFGTFAALHDHPLPGA